MANDALASREHLVGHLIREIDSALLQAATPIVGLPPPRSGSTGGASESRRSRAESVVRELELPIDDPAVAEWTSSRYDRSAHRSNLGPPRPFDPALWSAYERFLAIALDRVEARFHLITRSIDALLAAGPAHGDSQLLCSLPPGATSVALRHFFDRAPSEWIHHLPACVRRSAPAAAFAARVAADQPAAAASLIADMAAAGLADPYAHADLAAAAAAIPARLAVRWAHAEAAWVREAEGLPRLPTFRYFAAIDRLVDAGETEAALALVASLLELGPARGGHREVDARISDWDYVELLEGPVRRATALVPHAVLGLLIPVLAVAASRAEAGLGMSSFWLHSVADHPQDGTLGRSLVGLVRAVREAALGVAAAEGPEAAVRDLRAQPGQSTVGTRIGLHVIGATGRADLAVEWLGDEASHSHDCAREAYELVYRLRRAFDAAQREAIESILDGRPWGAAVSRACREALERPDAAELDQELGMAFTFHAVNPPPSPLTPEQLNALSVRDAVDLLIEARVSDDRDGPDVLPALEAAVAAEPARWALAVEELARLPTGAVSVAVHAFRKALREGDDAMWAGLLTKVAERLGPDGAWCSDAWDDVRQAAASLVVSYLVERTPVEPESDLMPAWRLIVLLAGQPRPAGTSPDADVPDRLVELGFGDVRATAVRAAVFLAWRARQAPRLLDEVLALLAGFAAREGSLEVRATMGFELPVLVVTAPDWLASTRDGLFPSGEWTAPPLLAVWEGYILSHQHLRFPSYLALGTEWLRWAEGLRRPHRESDERAAELTMVQYWHGRLGLEDPIMCALMANGSTELLSSTIEWIGQQVAIAETAEPDVGRRLAALWERRAASGAQSQAERSAFGLWFAGEVLDQAWAMAELERLAGAGVAFRDVGDVVGALHRRLAYGPAIVGRIAEAVVANQGDWNRLALAEQDIAAIVLALEADGAVETAAAGLAIRNRMVVKGFGRFAADAALDVEGGRLRHSRRRAAT